MRKGHGLGPLGSWVEVLTLFPPPLPPKQAREELLALIIDSRELKVTHSYRRAKEIF